MVQGLTEFSPASLIIQLHDWHNVKCIHWMCFFCCLLVTRYSCAVWWRASGSGPVCIPHTVQLLQTDSLCYKLCTDSSNCSWVIIYYYSTRTSVQPPQATTEWLPEWTGYYWLLDYANNCCMLLFLLTVSSQSCVLYVGPLFCPSQHILDWSCMDISTWICTSAAPSNS